ncbi:MAG TPA: hypothetical protein V6D29_02175 [Leptolyngbyaceae cyanobacterium]
MERELVDLSFEEWVLHVFDHEAEPSEPIWYHDFEAEYWYGPPAQIIEYLTRLFESPLPILNDYSDHQLNQGFWYIVSNGLSDYMFALVEESVPIEKRVACVHSFLTLFRDVFAVRCSPHLSHLDEPGASPLNSICYMWWDLLPIGGNTKTADGDTLNQAMLSVMEQSLHLPSIACQEGALHGLGHWAFHSRELVQTIIDTWLSTQNSLRPELLSYARNARAGYVQ